MLRASNSFFNSGSNNYVNVQQNIIGGGNNHIQFGGSPGTNSPRAFSTNIVGGGNNVINLDATGSNTDLFNAIIYGSNLSVNPKESITGLGVFGRWNKTLTGSTIFVVGNGTSSGDRRNAIEVTTNNQTILSGSVVVTGSLTLNGANVVTGSVETNRNGLITTGSLNGLQVMSSSLLVANTQTAGHAPLLQAQAFGFGQNAASFTGITNITGSLIVNGATVTGGSGSSGTSGVSGSSGTSGSNGSSGTSGATGTSGTSGSSGTSAIADLTGIITTGSAFADQQVQGTFKVSGSSTQPLQIGTGMNTARIDILNGGAAFYRNSSTYNTILGNVAGLNDGFTTGSEKNLLFTGFFLGFTSGSNNSIISGNGGANFKSGSANTIIGNVGNLQFGNNNTYIGSGGPNTLEDNTFRVAAGGADILVKSGSFPLQVLGGMEITGSLLVNTINTSTGSFVVTTDSTGTITKSPYSAVTANSYISGSNTTVGTAVLDGGSPGTATVSNSLVTANSLIFLTKQTNNHPNAGPVVVSSKGTGTFTITSNHNNDTDVVAYQIINPI